MKIMLNLTKSLPMTIRIYKPTLGTLPSLNNS